MRKQHTDKIKQLEAQSQLAHDKFEESRQETLRFLEEIGHVELPAAAPAVQQSIEEAEATFEETRRKALEMAAQKTAISICCDDISRMLPDFGCKEHYSVSSWKEAEQIIHQLNGSHYIIAFINEKLPEGMGIDILPNMNGLRGDKILILNQGNIDENTLEICIEHRCRPWVRPIDGHRLERLFGSDC